MKHFLKKKPIILVKSILRSRSIISLSTNNNYEKKKDNQSVESAAVAFVNLDSQRDSLTI